MLSKLGQRQAARFVASQAESVSRNSAAAIFHDPSLPGPSTRRAYASSSNPAQSPLATMRRTPRSSSAAHDTVPQAVFSRAAPMVVLPTPLPSDEKSAQDSYYFPRSSHVEMLNIIDACMFRGHDMPRARVLFDSLRENARASKETNPQLDVSMYNQFIITYFDLAAASEDLARRREMLKGAWDIWDNLGQDGVIPDYSTYSSLLMLSARFAPSAPKGIPAEDHRITASDILNSIRARSMSVPTTLERLLGYFDVTPTERALLFSVVQQWAVSEGQTNVLVEVGNLASSTEEGGAAVVEDDVPLVNPVVKKDVGSFPWQKPKKVDPNDPMTPYNLDALRSSMAELISTRRHLADDPISRQKLVEESAVDDARNRLNHQLQQLDERGLSSVSVMNSKKSIQKWMWDWYEALTPRIEEEIKAIIASEEQTRARYTNPKRKMTGTDRLNVGPFLSLLKPNQLALITIMEVLRLHGSGGIAEGMKTARALIQVGIAVENEYTALLRKRELNKRPNLERFDREATPGSLSDELDSAIPPAVPSSAPSSNNVLGMAGGLSHVVARREAAKRDALVENVTIPEWSRALQARIGGVLVDALMDTATVVRTTTLPNGETYTETQPAFNHEYEYLRGKKLGVIKLNPEVAAEFASKDSTGSGATLNPRHLPMFVPPRPWVSHNSGAYFYNRSTVMRIKDSIEQQQYVREASQNGNLELIFSALDVLGSTPWVVNREVFNVVLEVWNSGVGLADIPPTDLELPDPEKPADYDTNDVAKKEYLQDLKEVINKRRNNHSDRCSTNYKLEIARAFLPDKFYFPHNLDFRGRAYPIPPHLNHIGDDLSRGLLKFAEKRPLGVAGLRWLKIHLANVSGYDKASFDEREAWTMNHLEEIRDSARKPLEGNRWWTKSDDPWQTLATCKELTEALDLQDPTLFESNLPVHQDGTCNGLQHYAALGGDSVGAKQVNLDVTERPSDVYTYVANMVDKDLERDAANGDPIAQMLLGRIARKTVKQTVMTTVYGVTFVGARAQIEKQLRTAGDLDRDQLWKGSTYLARRTLNAIGTLFSGATAIQTWLSFVARIISKSIPPERVERSFEPGPKLPGRATPALTRANTEQMASVIWTTAMGLPIVQPYRKTKKKQLMTPVQSVFISDPNMQSQVNPMKQSSAFPPNFIHSLDATHMMLTALECRREELTFASVHDSYWTHACTVDRMSELIRNTFVYLHESDILAKLLDEFRTRYAGYQVPVMSLNQREIDHINATTDVFINVVKPAGRRKSKPLQMPLAREISDKEVDEEAEDSTTLAAEVANDPEAANLDVTVTRQTKRSPSSPTGEKTTTKAALAKQYVLLTDILPPLPAKGDFTVETIKKSLYFFS